MVFKKTFQTQILSQRPYRIERTSDQTITQVKQWRATSVRGWVTALVHWMLLAFHTNMARLRTNFVDWRTIMDTVPTKLVSLSYETNFLVCFTSADFMNESLAAVIFILVKNSSWPIMLSSNQSALKRYICTKIQLHFIHRPHQKLTTQNKNDSEQQLRTRTFGYCFS